MKLNDFYCEQWMTAYEKEAVYNMTDTSFSALSFHDLFDSKSLEEFDPLLDYGEITGDRGLKKEIERLYTTNDRALTFCHGALEGNEHVMSTLLEPGDHVIAFRPGYQQFYEYPRSLGCTVDVLDYEEENGWKLPFDAIENTICEKTKMIVLASPANPTGTTLTLKEWERLVELCKPHSIYILCDEVYRGLMQTPSVSDLYAYGISTGSLSKVYALPGLRFGWVRAKESVIDQINVRRDYTFISTGPLVDGLAGRAFRKKEWILKRNRALLEENRKILARWLELDPRFSIQMYEESPVAFLKYDFDWDSESFCRCALKEAGIFFVPGSCFGFEHHVRLGLGRESDSFQKGLYQLSQWLDETLKKT